MFLKHRFTKLYKCPFNHKVLNGFNNKILQQIQLPTNNNTSATYENTNIKDKREGKVEIQQKHKKYV